jgi:hypothetical protein
MIIIIIIITIIKWPVVLNTVMSFGLAQNAGDLLLAEDL